MGKMFILSFRNRKEKLKEEIKDKIKFTNRFFEYKRIDTSKYKEIKFQPTQPEKV